MTANNQTMTAITDAICRRPNTNAYTASPYEDMNGMSILLRTKNKNNYRTVVMILQHDRMLVAAYHHPETIGPPEHNWCLDLRDPNTLEQLITNVAAYLADQP